MMSFSTNFKLLKNKFAEYYFEEKEQWINWLPILFASGIIINLCIKEEIEQIYPFSIWIILLFLLSKFRKNLILSRLFLVSFTIISGFIILSIKAAIIRAPILKYNIPYTEIEGEVLQIIPLEKSYKIIVGNPIIRNHNQLKLRKIRINVRTNIKNLKTGDKIKFRASISPPPIPSIIGGYNFAFYAYFQQIGAVGFSLSSINIIENNNNNCLSNLRQNMGKSILNIMGARHGNIATALMIGEYNAIDKKILTNMRISGISHILSVSGMHLSLAATIFLFFFRIAINLIPYCANKLNVKKFASLFAILGSLAYLMISGMQIAAIRSFIMSSMIIASILIDRLSTPIRSVMFAFFIILILYPESIINPSFQMSFAAVIALISCYETYQKYIKISNKDNGILTKILFYILSTFFASIIAGIATSPYAAYHFNQFSGYGVITNLLAVPITSFIIMPAVILAFIFYPINLHFIALHIMSLGIEILIKISEYVANFPGSVAKISYISPLCLIFVTLSGLFYTLFRSKFRFLSIPIFSIALILHKNTKLNDLIITSNTYGFIYNYNLIIEGKKLSLFTKDSWLSYYGIKNISYSKNIKDYNCTENICDLYIKKYRVKFIFKEIEHIKCPDDDVIIDYYGNPNLENCNLKYINMKNNNNTYFIKLDENNFNIDIYSLKEYLGNRMWNIL